MKLISKIFTDFKNTLEQTALPSIEGDCTALSLSDCLSVNKSLQASTGVTIHSLGVAAFPMHSRVTVAIVAHGTINNRYQMFNIADATFLDAPEVEVIISALRTKFDSSYQAAA